MGTTRVNISSRTLHVITSQAIFMLDDYCTTLRIVEKGQLDASMLDASRSEPKNHLVAIGTPVTRLKPSLLELRCGARVMRAKMRTIEGPD